MGNPKSKGEKTTSEATQPQSWAQHCKGNPAAYFLLLFMHGQVFGRVGKIRHNFFWPPSLTKTFLIFFFLVSNKKRDQGPCFPHFHPPAQTQMPVTLRNIKRFCSALMAHNSRRSRENVGLQSILKLLNKMWATGGSHSEATFSLPLRVPPSSGEVN